VSFHSISKSVSTQFSYAIKVSITSLRRGWAIKTASNVILFFAIFMQRLFVADYLPIVSRRQQSHDELVLSEQERFLLVITSRRSRLSRASAAKSA
jgi:hypothetical protein